MEEFTRLILNGEKGKEIDVVMLTKNSNKPYFKRVLAAIKRNIPVHHFIVIDGYSSDGTIEVVRDFFHDKLIVVKTKASLGLARYIGMKFVDTEWFAFIDSDAEIIDGWYENAKPLIEINKVMSVQGVWITSTVFDNNSGTSIWVVRSIYEIPRGLIIKHGFYKFAGADTGHVLLRKDVVELLDIRQMSILEAGEDFYMAQKIAEAGYYYVKTAKLKAIHHGTRLNLRKILKRAFNAHGLALYIDTLTYFLYVVFRTLASLKKGDYQQFMSNLPLLLGLPKAKSIIGRIND